MKKAIFFIRSAIHPTLLLLIQLFLHSNTYSQCNINVNFLFQPDSSLAGTQIQFTPQVSGGQGGLTYAWEFGDGLTSNQANPTHFYTVTGCNFQTFSVKLKVTDSLNCVDSLTHAIVVRGAPLPSLIDTDPFSPFSNCDNNPSLSNPNFTINLLNSSKDTSAISHYIVDWGDLSPAQIIYNHSFPLSHTYLSLGLFNISFTAVSIQGCSTSVSYAVANQGNPAIGLSSQGSTQGCAPQTFQFVMSQYHLNSPGTYYVWDFGDGSPTVTWNYSTPFINDTITHTFNVSSCTQQANTFTVKVTAYNQCDYTTASVGNIRIYSPPVANFSIPVDTVCVNTPVCFQNNTISGFGYNCNSNATSSWNFGDPTSPTNTSTATNPCHTYANPGVYSITLNAGNSICGSSSLTKTLVVLAPPQAIATADTTFGCVPFSISTTNTSTGGALNYTWNITPTAGAGIIGGNNAATPGFQFTQAGNYTILLTASNKCGANNQSFSIAAAGSPQLNLTTPLSTCNSANFSPAYSVNNQNSVITAYTWNFPGATPSSSSSANPLVNYSTPGIYPFYLSIDNACGNTTDSNTFTVHSLPAVQLNAANTAICHGQSTTLTATGAATYSWAAVPGLNQYSGGQVSAQPSATSLYFVTGTDANGCSASDSIQLIVNPLPSLSASQTQAYICTGDSVLLSITGANTYVWSPSAGLSSTASASVFAFPVSNTLYNVVGTDTNGCVDSLQIPVNVSQNLILQIQPASLEICAGDSLQINVSGANAFSWAPAGGLSTTSGPTVKASPSATTTYTLTGFNSLGCKTDTNIVLQVNPLPLVNLAATQTTLCAGQTANLSASGGITYSWSPAIGLSATSGATVGASPATSAWYYLTATDIHGCFGFDSIFLTVNPLPTPLISASALQICSGDSVVLTATGGNTYQWVGSFLSNTLSDSTTAKPVVTTTYTLVVTDTNGCSQSAQTSIQVNPVPSVQISAPITAICGGDSAVFSASGATTYSWWPASGLSTATGATVKASPIGTTSYRVIGHTTYGCSDSADVNLIVNPLPIVQAQANPTIICAGHTSVLTASGAQTYQWSPVAGLSSPVGASVNAQPFSSQTYLVTGTDANGCQSLDSVSITVNQMVSLLVSPPQTSICNGDTTAIQVSGAATYQWSPATGIDNPAAANVLAFPASTTSYTVTGTDTNGCANQAQVVVSVNPLPVASINPPLPVICSGDSITLSAGGGISYQWPGNQTGSQITVSPLTTTSYTLTVTDANNCQNTAQITVTVNNLPQLNLSLLSGNVCSSDTVFMNVSGAQNYQWTGNGLLNTTGPSALAVPLASGMFSVTGVDANGCSNITQAWINVNPLPVVSINPPNPSICRGENVVLTASGAAMYQWTPSTALNTNMGPVVIASPVNSTFYTLTATDTNGCIAHTGVNVQVFSLPLLNFSHDSIVCRNTPVSFNNYSSGSTQYSWDFGNGIVSTTYSPSTSYGLAGSFPIRLIGNSGLGCSDTAYSSIQVIDIPQSIFTTSSDSGCTPLSIQFNNLTTGYMPTYAWQLGNGSTCNLKFPPQSVYLQGLQNDTSYTISLTASNQCGSHTSTKTVKVMPKPTAIFGLSPVSGCSPLTVNFANTSLGLPVNYSWNMGNGGSYNQLTPPPTTYLAGSNDSTYTIRLIASNACGCDTLEKTILVKPQSVTAFFTPSANAGCAPHTVQFANFSTLTGTMQWSFGDGNFSTQYSPNHTYSVPGTYHVTLIVGDTCSSDTAITTVTVNPKPVIAFNLSNDSICLGEQLVLTNNTLNLSASNWCFGDGNTCVLTNTSHQYTQAGQYPITLTGTMQNSGCIDSLTKTIYVKATPNAEFTLTDSVSCIPFAINIQNNSQSATYYAWDFGDGNGSVLSTPQHTYTQAGSFQIRLITAHASGCTDTTLKLIAAHPRPGSQFTMSSSSICVYPGGPVLLNNSIGAQGYLWDFGNGTTSSLTNPTVTYTAPGTYPIQLVSYNQFNCSDTAVSTFIVSDPPKAGMSLLNNQGCPPLQVEFTNTSTGSVVSCHWNFGDGATGVGNNNLHNYLQSGKFSIQLIARGIGNCADTLTWTDSVFVFPKPIPDFTYENTNTPVANSGGIQFSNTTQFADAYAWHFDDGNSGTEKNPFHRYQYDGEYQVMLTAWNNYGCYAGLEKTIKVDLIKGLFIPNAFSPDNPSPDVRLFLPIGRGLREYNLSIYDSWGNKVWETDQLDEHGQPLQGWNGEAQGKPMHQDVYVWKVSAIFNDNSIWKGNDNGHGEYRSYGTLLLIR